MAASVEQGADDIETPKDNNSNPQDAQIDQTEAPVTGKMAASGEHGAEDIEMAVSGEHGAEDIEMAVSDEHGAEDIEMEVVINSNPKDAQNAQMEAPVTERMSVRDEHGSNVNRNSNLQDSPAFCICRRQRNPTDSFPSDVLLAGDNRKDRLDLYTAALNGDWKTAESIIRRNCIFVNSSVTEEYQTALHVAAGAKQTGFVKKLVKLKQDPKCDLKLQDEKGNTAFCLAVQAGSVAVAEILLKKDSDLAFIRGGQNSRPLLIAVLSGHRDMVRLLVRENEKHLDHLDQPERKQIFFASIETDMFDLALKLLKKYDDLAEARKKDYDDLADDDLAEARQEEYLTALHMLSRKPLASGSKRPGIVKMLINSYLELVTSLWQKFLDKNQDLGPVKEHIDRPFNLLIEAAELGNYEFLAALIRLYPELIWWTDSKNQTIFHIAVLHRQVNIFSQIYSIGWIKDVMVTYTINGDNPEFPVNMLHLAAKTPSSHRLDIVSGYALQMQRELLWFQEVNNIMRACDREKKDRKGLTPRKLFSEEHKELLEKGKEWMRTTSNSCMIVATLITTVVYSAGFSPPGGNDSTKGFPVQINHILFHVFAVSEAVALSFSITSTLMFLFILTSRYAEEDFLKSLPMKLMLGLVTLFISMMAMIAAFISAFFLAYRDSYDRHNLRSVPLLISGLASLPAIVFVLLQFPLLLDIFRSTCFSRCLFRPSKSIFV